MVHCARQGDDPGGAAQAALDQLFRDYWPPLYAFARRRGLAAPDAQDLVQGFFVHLFETAAYASVDRARGKFRSFLLVSFKHYLADDRDRRRAAKRGGDEAPLWIENDAAAIEARSAETRPSMALPEESVFERQWASAVVERALAALAATYADGGKRERVFRELKPFLTGGAGLPGRAEVAARLGTTEDVLNADLARLRARYRASLRAEAARTVPPGTDPDEEMAYLCRVLLAVT